MPKGDYVFLSYSHIDPIESYCTALREAGYGYYFDESISYGEEWDLKVRRQISNSKCKGVILFLSENSVVSNSILTEIEYAEKYSKPYTAVLLKASSVGEIFSSVIKKSNENQRFVAECMHEFFPQNKLYIKEDEFKFDENSKLKNTFVEWGFAPDVVAEEEYRAAFYWS